MPKYKERVKEIMPEKLEYALFLASLGFYIFPCEANGKLPIVPWREKSTRNPETIKNWWIDPYLGWQQDSNIGIDCGKSGIFVVDVDCKAGKAGTASLKKLEKEHGFGKTFTVTTPSGGKHIYYDGAGYGNTAEKLAPGIDTRGDGGFVLAPTSTIDGKAYVAHGDPQQKILMPDWLRERMAKHKTELHKESKKAIVEDQEGDIAAAVHFLEKEAEHAVEGAGGDHRTFVTICQLKERGISKEKALELIEEHWNPYCSPPWDHDDLIKKVNSAWKSARNATGALSPHAEFDVPAPAPKPSLAASLDPSDSIDKIPHRDWVYGHLALRKKVSVIVAPGGMGKSTLTLSMALSKATGRDLLGINPRGRGRVWLYNNEDDMEELRRRMFAIMQHYQIPYEDLFEPDVLGDAQKSYLMLNSGEDRPFRIAKRSKDGFTIRPDMADELLENLLRHKIDMMIVDPFAETHAAKENDNEEILHVGRMFRAVAQRANCSLVLVHHTRKLDGAGSDGHSGNLDSMRGASSLGGLARIVVTFNSMSEKQAKEFGVKKDDRHRFVLLEQAKANMSAASVNNFWFERQSEIINPTLGQPDGESVGVLRPVTMKVKDTVNEATVALIADIESLVEGAAMTVPDIAAELVAAFPFHEGKSPRSVAKAIRRLMENGEVTGLRGRLVLEEKKRTGGQTPVQMIRMEVAKEKSLDDLF